VKPRAARPKPMTGAITPFIDAAKEAGVDETGQEFEKAFKKLALNVARAAPPMVRANSLKSWMPRRRMPSILPVTGCGRLAKGSHSPA